MADRLKAIFNETMPEPDEEEVRPCAAIAKNKWIQALTIQHSDRPWESFQFKGLCVRSVYTPTAFSVGFLEEDATYWVTVTGRNLARIYNLVIQARLEWIRAADRDFAQDGEQVITRIEVTKDEASR